MPDLLREEATNQCTHTVRIDDNAPRACPTVTPGEGPEVELNLVQGLGAPALLTRGRARDFSDVCLHRPGPTETWGSIEYSRER